MKEPKISAASKQNLWPTQIRAEYFKTKTKYKSIYTADLIVDAF